jgi:hypothetical protein
MLTRNPLWPDLLADYLGERLAMPFAWGSHDCCMFAAEWVRICTGEDFAKGYRGKYRSEAGALKLLKRDGGVVGIVEAAPSRPCRSTLPTVATSWFIKTPLARGPHGQSMPWAYLRERPPASPLTTNSCTSTAPRL